MNAKKYLSLQEAADQLGMRPDELLRLREKSEVRGFADRGTWKFKLEDIQELGRRRQVDSDPEVPMFEAEKSDDDLDSAWMSNPLMEESPIPKPPSDSDVRLTVDRSKLASSSSEMPIFDPMGSDSDVRLAGEGGPKPKPKSDSDVRIPQAKGKKGDSDSDVQLKGSAKNRSDTDEEFRLDLGKTQPDYSSDSESDVKLALPDLLDTANELTLMESGVKTGGAGSTAKKRSDSDVKLTAGKKDQDSDLLRLSKSPGSDSDVKLAPSRGGKPDSGIQLRDDDSILTPFDEDSSIAGSVLLGDDDDGLTLPGDSGIRLVADSGVQLRAPADSGILLERPADSGLRLGGDSSGGGRALTDSGIPSSLGGDSGLRLGGDSGFKLGGESGLALDRGSRGSGKSASLTEDHLDLSPSFMMDDDFAGTDVEVPLLTEDGTDQFRFDASDSDTGEVMFDDDMDSSTSQFNTGSSAEFDVDSSLDGDDELEVSPDVMGEDEELGDLEVFETDDSSFTGEIEIGGGEAMVVSGAAAGAEWGAGTIWMALFSTSTLAVCALLAFDLLRLVWAQGDPTIGTGGIVDFFAGLFKQQ